MNTLVISPAPGWYAIVKEGDREIRVPVLYWEVMVETPLVITRRAMVFYKKEKRLVDALQSEAFDRLVYEPILDLGRVLSEEEIHAWLEAQGADEKDIRAWTKDLTSRMLAQRLAERRFQELTAREYWE